VASLRAVAAIDAPTVLTCSSGRLPSVRQLQFFAEFKRRAVPYVRSRPQNDWEWLALASIMDYQPACSIGRGIRLSHSISLWRAAEKTTDAILIAYQHNHPTVDVNKVHPFEIQRIELYEPAMISDRLVAQSAVFTAEPGSVTESEEEEERGRILHTLAISAKTTRSIYQELQSLGITRSSLFPARCTLRRTARDSLGRELVEAAGVELSGMLTARKLLILGTATTAKKATLPDPLYVYCTKMLTLWSLADRHSDHSIP
jgi:hypothetical protein